MASLHFISPSSAQLRTLYDNPCGALSSSRILNKIGKQRKRKQFGACQPMENVLFREGQDDEIAGRFICRPETPFLFPSLVLQPLHPPSFPPAMSKIYLLKYRLCLPN